MKISIFKTIHHSSLFFLALQFSINASAKSFELQDLAQAEKPSFVLQEATGKSTYFEFIRGKLGPALMVLAAETHGRKSNEEVLKAGGGISVQVSEHNYNVHINYPAGPLGGRSYGWTKGQVGDWSDAMYLDRIANLQKNISENERELFYQTLIQVLGNCDASQLEKLSVDAQTVASNFIAIYTAEAYRAMVPDAHENWDEALFEVTMLASFHAGQDHLVKFYVGEFSDKSRKQNPGVYNRGRPGSNFAEAAEKSAELKDYWQFSGNPTSRQSGINITRKDFEKMGEALTAYELTVKRNPVIGQIFAIVSDKNDKQKNVIKSIAGFFTQGHAKKGPTTDKLSKLVAQLMVDLHQDAADMTRLELAK